MTRPEPTLVYHFTHRRHLLSIVEHGLLSDVDAAGSSRLEVEIGHTHIKERRRVRQVPVQPGGMVGDYVPFYFAPRSPMLFAIGAGNVATYGAGTVDLVYLVSSVERLLEHGCDLVFTDRNAVLATAAFRTNQADLDELVDWELMTEAIWRKTDRDPDRPERRSAECLAHRMVPWAAFLGVGTRTEAVATAVRQLLATVTADPFVRCRPGWYF